MDLTEIHGFHNTQEVKSTKILLKSAKIYKNFRVKYCKYCE